MTTRQKKALGNQLVAIATALGVKGWTFNLMHAPSREGTNAEIECIYGRRVANVSFSSHWWDLDAEDRHHTLVHEVLHIVTDPIRTYLDETMPTLLGAPAWVAVQQAIRQHEEHAVDQLATALAPHLPVMEDV